MLKSPSTQQFLQISWRPILVRILLFACLWWILTDGTPASWSVGVPAILIASYISLRFSRAIPFKLDYLSLLSFILFFCWQSLLAGIDVAKRVLQPRLPLNLGLVEFPTQLSPGTPAHTLLVNAINLLPGTLVTRIRRHSLTLHVLDTQAPIAAEAQALETRIAALFRLPHTNSSNHEKTGSKQLPAKAGSF